MGEVLKGRRRRGGPEEAGPGAAKLAGPGRAAEDPSRAVGRGAGRRGPAAILRRTIPAARQGPLRPAGGRGGARARRAGSGRGARTLRLPPRYVTAGARARSLPPSPSPPPTARRGPMSGGAAPGGGAGESPADGAGARTHGGKARPRGSACALPSPPRLPLSLSLPPSLSPLFSAALGRFFPPFVRRSEWPGHR